MKANHNGNKALAAVSPNPVEVTSCKYAPELTLEQVKALNGKRPPKIEIDMFWGIPRLNIDKADGSFACVVYRDGKMSDAQAFGDKGLDLAIDMRTALITYSNNKIMAAEFTFRQDWENDGMLDWDNAKTLKRYRELCDERGKVDMKRFDCFFAFSDEQFKQGLKSIRPLQEGEKLVRICGGGFATKDGAERLGEYYRSMREKIAQECDPQEVYCYEFNNHESMIAYDGDKDALQLVLDIWGADAARKVRRFCAFYSTESLIQADT